METATQFASSPHDFKLLVAADGKRGTTMDDLDDAEQAPRAGRRLSVPAPRARLQLVK